MDEVLISVNFFFSKRDNPIDFYIERNHTENISWALGKIVNVNVPMKSTENSVCFSLQMMN